MPTLIPGSVAKQSFLLRSHGSYRVGILKDTCIIFLFPQKPWHPLLQIPTPRNSRFKIKRFAYSNYRTHANSASGYYFHTRHLGGLVIEFSARDLLLEKVFYFDGKNYGQGSSIIYSKFTEECKECDCNLCDSCINDHNNFKLTRNHEMLLLKLTK